jgi:hypothetical protein
MMNKERELLNQIHYCWVTATNLDDNDPEVKILNDVMREAEHYLFHESESEPVAWACRNKKGEVGFVTLHPEEYPDEKFEPVYLHSDKPDEVRKPMTREERQRQYEIEKSYIGESVLRAFYIGIVTAELHHGIK